VCVVWCKNEGKPWQRRDLRHVTAIGQESLMIEDVGSLRGITPKVTANQPILRFLPIPKNRWINVRRSPDFRSLRRSSVHSQNTNGFVGLDLSAGKGVDC
jgi:hypothetical protein